MKDRLINIFELKYMTSTKWNEIYENDTHVFIFNRTTRECKIKAKM
jgi:hypothetical protein